MGQQTLRSAVSDNDQMVSTKRLKRARSALDELENGDMTVDPQPDGTFEVKDYTVDLGEMSCSCADHEYRVTFCKHLVAARLQAMWGNVSVPDTDSDTEQTPPKPSVLDPELAAIPESLRELDQWVCWKQKLHENKDGSKRWTKVPDSPVTGGLASSTDSDTWGTFRDTIGYYNRDGDAVGVGVVISATEDDLIGIDIDDCRDPESGELDDSVEDILSDVDTYAEVSPSGTGIRIFVYGNSEYPDECEADLPGEAHIEMYVTGRYLTVTGHQLDSVPSEVYHDESTVREFDRRTHDDEAASLADY